MGFFDKIKSMVGIGQPKLAMTIEGGGNQIKRGTKIKGTITMEGGSRDVPVKKFEVKLIEIVTRREWSDVSKKYVDRKIENDLGKLDIPKNDEILKGGETMTAEFELEVSTAAMVTGHPYAHRVKASADVPGLDPSAKQDIYVI